MLRAQGTRNKTWVCQLWNESAREVCFQGAAFRWAVRTLALVGDRRLRSATAERATGDFAGVDRADRVSVRRHQLAGGILDLLLAGPIWSDACPSSQESKELVIRIKRGLQRVVGDQPTAIEVHPDIVVTLVPVVKRDEVSQRPSSRTRNRPASSGFELLEGAKEARKPPRARVQDFGFRGRARAGSAPTLVATDQRAASALWHERFLGERVFVFATAGAASGTLLQAIFASTHRRRPACGSRGAAGNAAQHDASDDQDRQKRSPPTHPSPLNCSLSHGNGSNCPGRPCLRSAGNQELPVVCRWRSGGAGGEGGSQPWPRCRRFPAPGSRSSSPSRSF
jgi:hypothetical protein